MQLKAVSPATTSAHTHGLAATTWLVLLALGGYLRWSYPQLTLFGLDQQTVVHMGQAIRLGWERPLVGVTSALGAVQGAVEYYLMTVPQFFSDAPEFSAAYVGLLGLLAGAIFSAAVWRVFGKGLALGAWALFVTGPWAVHYTRTIWTPDTAPLFTALAYALLVASLAYRVRWALPLAALALGIVVQIHQAGAMLLPGAALCLLLCIRRVRPLELIVGLLLFAATFAPWLLGNLQRESGDLQRLLSAGNAEAQVDLLAPTLLQNLAAGAGYPLAGGALIPGGQAPLAWPGLTELLVGAFWLGVVLAVWRVARDCWRRRLEPSTVALALALGLAVLPAAIDLRHSVSLYFRYFVCTFPVLFLFPALAFAAIPGWLARLSPSRGRVAGEWAMTALLALAAVGGAWRVEAVNQAFLTAGAVPAAGQSDMFPLPFIKDSRVAMQRLEQIVSADYDTIVTGSVARGPLEYLAANRYRLRYIDQPTMLVLPVERSRMVFLPDSYWAADLALALGGVENKNVALLWPPSELKTRLVDVDPARVAISDRFTKVAPGQVLPNGLELLAYAVENSTARGCDLLTVWRVANAEWAHRFWLYNSFTHAATLTGQQVDIWGEVELSTSSNWKQGDLLVVPTKVVAQKDLARGGYKLQMGVYVRFPARQTIPVDPGATEVVSIEPARLGQPTVAETTKPVATFEQGISLQKGAAKLSQDGKRVDINFGWRSEDGLQRDYTVFAHVYDAQGKLVAQADSFPVAGNYPTSLWPAGEYVSDDRTVELQSALAPGDYTIKVGLYDAKTMQRLKPAPATSDLAVAVATIRVPAK
ncbi:MAG: hypothetical protein M1401_09820 [Chloroflexi bacterium]|nr:hypothetical protein [Chloroflexota bacterium]